jgi:hypothetical protein
MLTDGIEFRKHALQQRQQMIATYWNFDANMPIARTIAGGGPRVRLTPKDTRIRIESVSSADSDPLRQIPGTNICDANAGESTNDFHQTVP